MANRDLSDELNLANRIMTIAAYACFIGLTVIRLNQSRSGISAIRSYLREVRKGFKHSLPDPLHSNIYKVVQLQRVEQVRIYLQPMAYTLLSYLIVRKIGGRFTTLNDFDRNVAEIQIAFSLLMVSVLGCRPTLITPWSIDLVYVLVSICWPLYRSGHGSEYVIWTSIGIFVCNAKLTVSWNMVMMIIRCAVILAWNPLYPRSVHHSPGLPEPIMYQVGEEIASTMLIVPILLYMECRVWNSARKGMVATLSSQIALKSLLSAMCDAVVTLGPNLHITERCPELSNLLNTPAASDLLAVSFETILDEGDRSRFRQFLSQAQENDSSLSSAFLVDLRLAGGGATHVQILHSQFYEWDGSCAHLIGISILGECRQQATDCGPSDAILQAKAQENSNINTRSIFSISESGSSLEDSCSFLDQGQTANVKARHCNVSIFFDALHFKVFDAVGDKPIINADLSEKESLQQWIAEWKSTQTWIEKLVESVLKPLDARPIRGPCCIGFDVQFRGFCQASKIQRSRISSSQPQTAHSSATRVVVKHMAVCPNLSTTSPDNKLEQTKTTLPDEHPCSQEPAVMLDFDTQCPGTNA